MIEYTGNRNAKLITFFLQQQEVRDIYKYIWYIEQGSVGEVVGEFLRKKTYVIRVEELKHKRI